MNDTDRRGALRTLAVQAMAFAALVPVALSGAPLLAQNRRTITLPAGPMILRRVVERDLADGSTLVVKREWECLFVRQGRMINVTGRQTGAWVDAPPRLEQLAALERQRDAGLLPMLLDGQGLVVADAPYIDQPSIDKAVAVAAEIINQSERSHDSKQDAHRFLSQVANSAAGMISTTPPDLFFPARSSGHETRDMALPDGAVATITVELVVEADQATGQLRRMDKRIVTRIDDSEQAARELWEMQQV